MRQQSRERAPEEQRAMSRSMRLAFDAKHGDRDEHADVQVHPKPGDGRKRHVARRRVSR
jgi:hypothetical protein